MATGFHRPYRGGSSRGNFRGRGRARSSGNVILGFNALQKLRGKDPDDIVLDLASERCIPAFKALLNKTEYSKDMVELVMEVLASSCDSNSPEYFNKLLTEIPRSLFIVLHLKSYITRLYMQRNFTTNLQLFVERTVRLFSEILKRIPSAFETLPLGDLELAAVTLKDRGLIDDVVIREVEQLKVIKEESLEKQRRKEELETLRKTRAHNQETGAVGPPPEDFREMTIIPQCEDIYTDKKPYLRKNIVEGGYDDLDHYLDVQFRLLREDFLRPLREGIVDLVSRGIEEKQGMFKDIRVYRNVKILYPECSNSGLLHHIQFDNSRLRWVRWENSKRLIFGSLLCLSKDNFQTFVFATVANRDPKELVHGKVTVRFMDSTFDTQDFSRRNIYQMVETTAYFEAYSPILKGLQQTEPKDLPFQSYLVECNKDIQPPKYLVRNRFALSTPSFNFSSILVKDTDVHVSELDYIRRLQRLRLGSSNVAQFQAVPVLDVTQWPSKDQLGLDESQYKALQIALTKEVAVIQGPPGTGKTYLGLKIAKILLDNKEKWIEGTPTLIANRREVNQTPILVICYTNHALDQFLEGIYDFHGENENKIVRIGGRSKSEKLKECNLSAIKYRSKKAPIYIRRGIYEVYQNLEGVTHAMERSSNILKKCWQNILFERTLHRTGVVKEQHYQALMRPFDTEGFGGPEPGSVVLRWLNLVAGETVQDEYVAIDDHIKRFNGQDMIMCEGLLLAGNDFSISTEVKTRQGGAIISSVAVDGRWTNNSKLVYIDPNGIVKFIAAQNTLCETYSSVNDDKWHEIAVVYSEEENRLTLYVDKRMEGTQTVAIPNDNPYNVQIIGYTPNFHLVTPGHFVGHMRNFVYCPSTKYSEQVTGDVSVEYEIEFMQEQRKVDGECDIPDKFTPRSVPRVDDFDVVDPSDLVTSTGGWEVQNKKRAKNKIKFEVIKQLQSDDVMTDEEVSTIQNVWSLEVRDRWRLYRKWVRDISQQHQNTIALVQDEYDKGMKELQELRNAESYELLREAHVIGMTTTGAAKYRDLLHRIKPKITIVEEAAEVLESHIVTALTGGCEHLILIGDHKQLRPKPTVFQLGLDYQLDISLFERMVENGMPFARLRKQHRMRPEISVMMRPIYDDLLDHDSVRNKKNIKGINKNIFFIDHVVKEDAVDENKSHSNIHEAKFIGSLCKYLLQQGYLPSQITVLTPYTGQLFQLKKFVPNVKDLRICVVDNFQGEENDIILLSLVRSRDFVKSEKKDMRRMIGFLAIDNRICVSLSRAKEGFFCIGNLSLMRSANDLWSEILDDMEARGSVGKALPLACQNHPTTITHVSNEADFNKAPNGGCSVLCQARLACGHSCEQICHPTDPQHLEYSCRKKCPKKCIRDHPCRRLCYQDCGKCMVTIAKVVPKCGHIMSMPCHQDPETFQCTKPCTKNLPCGHACPNKCGEACTKRCLEQVTKKWFPCGHSNKTPCYIDPATEKCPNPCGTVLKCEHICTGTCGGCKQGRLHEPCSSRCDRLRFCGHQCKVPCTKNCPPCPEICPNRCPHSKCRNKCGEPCKECKEPCKWRCVHYTCTKLCGELCDRPRCNRPCAKFKRCGHACPGLCGESCPRKCLVCDKEELTEIFFGGEDEEDARFLELADCRHVFEVKGMDQYMDMQVKDLKKGQSTSIQMIKCPRCHTAIRTSLRYEKQPCPRYSHCPKCGSYCTANKGNIIKSILQDFENVKRTIETGNMISQPDEFRRKVRDEIEASDLESEFPDEVYEITKAAGTAGGLTRDKQNIVENQIQFLKFMTKLKAILKQVERVDNRHYFHRMLSSNAREDEIALLKHELQMLSKWVMEQRHRFSEQELEDFNDELLRSWIMFSYKALNIGVERRKIELSDLQTSRIEYVKKKLASGKKLKESQKEKCIKYLDYIAQKHPSLNVKYTSVTEEEKKMIVKAMGFEQGHWFKCPQGHVYCIGECGGATQEADCPECGSRIGGSRHQIRPDNLLAPEMDGARFPAWSDTANNMRNWIFD